MRFRSLVLQYNRWASSALHSFCKKTAAQTGSPNGKEVEGFNVVAIAAFSPACALPARVARHTNCSVTLKNRMRAVPDGSAGRLADAGHGQRAKLGFPFRPRRMIIVG